MENKAFMIFAIVILILSLLTINNIMLFAIKHNKMKKGLAISYMIISILSGIAISSFPILNLLADL
ncbi:hypothetical protein RA177_03255 [Bacillus safensis]|uniref:hypothetical protein n=1 Tax=Bacillus TaxID=1386 RepID=UPI0019D03903|nr:MULTISPECIES: hypothetical protein [Bacillus]QSJ00920.1 hypothetical protein JJ692_17845 [Bacillus sp. 3a]WLW70167.1 hypothetical protein RA177_03255 [Bacillus safensis]